jgi:N-acetylneuraminic acid mutarotase
MQADGKNAYVTRTQRFLHKSFKEGVLTVSLIRYRRIRNLRLRLKIVCICTMMSLVAFGSAQLELGFALDMPSPSWRTKTAMPTARGQAAIIAGDDGLIYAMGGFTGGAPVSTVEAYNPLTDTWTTKTSMPQAARGAVVAKGLDGIIYVVSGAAGYLTTVQAYNTTSDTWSTKTSIPSGVWMAGAAAGNDGKIYVIGGEPSTYPSPIAINRTQIYDPSTDTWANGTDMPTARSELGVIKGSDGLIYAMGGYNGSVLSLVEAYDPSTDVWTEKTPMPSPKLEFALVLGPDEKIYVIGGGTNYFNNAGTFFDTVEIYDPQTDTWTIPGWSESSMPTARKEFGAASGSNGRIYAIGGANGAYISTNEEASIVIPENIPPTAYIDSVTPNPTTRGQIISFVGHGADSDGSVAAYKWRSSIDGTINASATFSKSTLTSGTHTVYFSVKDNLGSWSEEATAIVIVNIPVTEDPIYQELLNLNETLNDKIDDLSQQNDALSEQNANLTTKVDGLSQQNDALSEQNANLTDMVDNLTQKIDTMTLELLAASVVIIVLVIVTIVVTYISKRK